MAGSQTIISDGRAREPLIKTLYRVSRAWEPLLLNLNSQVTYLASYPLGARGLKHFLQGRNIVNPACCWETVDTGTDTAGPDIGSKVVACSSHC